MNTARHEMASEAKKIGELIDSLGKSATRLGELMYDYKDGREGKDAPLYRTLARQFSSLGGEIFPLRVIAQVALILTTDKEAPSEVQPRPDGHPTAHTI